MKAVVFEHPGGPEVLELRQVPVVVPGPDEVRVKVHATALNRADLLQRRGLYPAPPGASSILGLEFSGVVEALGDFASGVELGQRVMGLLPGGGYAEYAVAHPRTLLPLWSGLSFEGAAAIPEAFLTAQEALFAEAELMPGERVLIHAAAGGVGSAAVALAVAHGAEVVASVRQASKAAYVAGLGAQQVVVREEQDLVAVVQALGGVDVIIDTIGAALAAPHIKLLRPRGRWVVLGLLGGSKAELDLALVLGKRARILGMVMRSRGVGERIALTERFRREHWPLFESGRLAPKLDSVYALEDVRLAHERMEQNLNTGKIVLRVVPNTGSMTTSELP